MPRHLLDVNVLLAAIWSNHPQHAKAFAWLAGKSIVLCPLAELGFLRVSTNRKAINAPMEQARKLLEQFATDREADRFPDDLPALSPRTRGSPTRSPICISLIWPPGMEPGSAPSIKPSSTRRWT